jgi:hypothetical protein
LSVRHKTQPALGDDAPLRICVAARPRGSPHPQGHPQDEGLVAPRPGRDHEIPKGAIAEPRLFTRALGGADVPLAARPNGEVHARDISDVRPYPHTYLRGIFARGRQPRDEQQERENKPGGGVS